VTILIRDAAGRHALSGAPRTCRRKLSASGGPARTANTPAFSRGISIKAAQSPAAKNLRIIQRLEIRPCGDKAAGTELKAGVSQPTGPSRVRRHESGFDLERRRIIELDGPGCERAHPPVLIEFHPALSKDTPKGVSNSAIMGFKILT
jgi:hypothetical protein